MISIKKEFIYYFSDEEHDSIGSRTIVEGRVRIGLQNVLCVKRCLRWRFYCKNLFIL